MERLAGTDGSRNRLRVSYRDRAAEKKASFILLVSPAFLVYRAADPCSANFMPSIKKMLENVPKSGTVRFRLPVRALPLRGVSPLVCQVIVFNSGIFAHIINEKYPSSVFLCKNSFRSRVLRSY
jgi:hypothetical protein